MNPTKPLIDNSFVRTVQEYRKGELLNDLSDALRKVCEAVDKMKAPGKLTLEIVITPSGEAYTYRPEIKTKLPKEPKPSAIFFMDENFSLVREDPRQSDLKLEIVKGGQTETQPQPLAQPASMIP